MLAGFCKSVLQPVALLVTLPHYISLLNIFYTDRNTRFPIRTTRQDYLLCTSANYCQVYGLNPGVDNFLSNTSPLNVTSPGSAGIKTATSSNVSDLVNLQCVDEYGKDRY